MFLTFLIGTLALSVLVLIALLVQPRADAGDRHDTPPYVGMTLAVLFAILAVLGGLAVAA